MTMPGMELGTALAPALRGWSVGDFAFMFAMWAIMMVGMMLPSVAPMLLIYAGVARQAGSRGKPFAATAWFATGYLLAWTAFSMLATSAQWALESVLLLAPMTGIGAKLGGIVLIAAGVYQCTPLKDVCLSACQSPLQFIMRHGGFRPDPLSAMNLGAEHGIYCIGCCWALMAILFVVGIMNLLWVAVIAAFILLEKLVVPGRLLSRAAGAALIVAGAWMLF
jgi:predicted metal-binding membrane protein